MRVVELDLQVQMKNVHTTFYTKEEIIFDLKSPIFMPNTQNYM